MNKPKLVKRSDIVNYMKVGEDSTFKRMKYFPEMSKSKEVEEYDRQYVDENSKRVDAISMSEVIEFEMDRHINDEVHQAIVDIFDKEKLGDDANVTLCTVNFTEKGTTPDSYKARIREYSLIPEGEGEDIEAYKHTGAFKSKGDIIEGEATTTDEWLTCTFKEDSEIGEGDE